MSVSALEGGSDEGKARGAEGSLYTFDVSTHMGSSDYIKLFDDVLRMLCIQLTIQIMLYFSGDAGATFLSREFVLLLMYVELGVMLYWLVVRKLLKFA